MLFEQVNWGTLNVMVVINHYEHTCALWRTFYLILLNMKVILVHGTANEQNQVSSSFSENNGEKPFLRKRPFTLYNIKTYRKRGGANL
jgi:hypothetical protein